MMRRIMSRATIISSNGEPFARGYAVAHVRPISAEPSVPDERIVLVPPTQTPTRSGPVVRAGPRDAQQTTWPPPKALAVVLLDGRPPTKAQRFWIDGDLLAKWDAEAELAERMRSA